jgi:hypothetical protein
MKKEGCEILEKRIWQPLRRTQGNQSLPGGISGDSDLDVGIKTSDASA